MDYNYSPWYVCWALQDPDISHDSSPFPGFDARSWLCSSLSPYPLQINIQCQIITYAFGKELINGNVLSSWGKKFSEFIKQYKDARPAVFEENSQVKVNNSTFSS